MVNFKISKTGDAVYYSHHDMMRLLLIALRRAEVPVKTSKRGKLKVYFSPATSIGSSSVAEFVQIDTDLTAHKVAFMLETYLPAGIKIIKELDTKQRINISSIAKLAKYEIVIDEIEKYQKQISDLLTSQDFKVSRRMNGRVHIDSPAKFIHNFYFENKKLYVFCSVGEDNINIVQTIVQILNKIGAKALDLNINKTNIFAYINERYHDIELMLIRNSK